MKVNVSASKAITSTEPFEAVDNAEITLYENDNFAEIMVWREQPFWVDPIDRGYYYSIQTKPQAGNIYRIEVEVPGFDPVTAETSMPIKTTIRYLNHSFFQEDEPYASRYMRSFLEMENPAMKEKFYLFISTRHTNSGSLRYVLFEINDPVLGVSKGDMNADYLVFTNEIIQQSMYPFHVDIMEQDLALKDLAVFYNLATLSEEA